MSHSSLNNNESFPFENTSLRDSLTSLMGLSTRDHRSESNADKESGLGDHESVANYPSRLAPSHFHQFPLSYILLKGNFSDLPHAMKILNNVGNKYLKTQNCAFS